MIACPKCKRNVPEKRTCMYCGALLTAAPAAVQGMSAAQWIAEGIRVAELGQRDRAIACFDKAITASPDNPTPWLNRSVLLQHVDRDEAERSARRALELAPGNPTILKHLETLARIPRGLPPGRPGQPMMAELMSGDPASVYALATTKALYAMGVVQGADDILVMNWYLEVPAPPADLSGAGWNVGTTRQKGLLARYVTQRKTAVTACHTADEAARAMPDTALDQHELEAWAWLLERGVIEGLTIFGNLPWGDGPSRRVQAANAKLAAHGVPEGRRITLVVIDEKNTD